MAEENKEMKDVTNETANVGDNAPQAPAEVKEKLPLKLRVYKFICSKEGTVAGFILGGLLGVGLALGACNTAAGKRDEKPTEVGCVDDPELIELIESEKQEVTE